MNLQIKRRNTRKTHTTSLRLTKDDTETVNWMKTVLNFASITDIFLHALKVFKQLYEWHHLGYHFYIGCPEKKEYKEVDFDF